MAEYHDAHFTPHPSRTAVWSAVAAHLATWLPEQGDILEIGAGYCDWINQVSARRRVAIDRWPGVAQYAAPGVEPLVLDLTGGLQTLADRSFDGVLASNVLEHFDPESAERVAGDLTRLLRPGGRLIAIQPNFRYAWRRYFDDYTHRAVFTDVSLPAMLRAQGLRIDRVDPRFLPYSMSDSRVPLRRWLVRAYLASPVRPLAGQMLVIASKP